MLYNPESEEIAELKSFQKSVENLKQYIQRQIDLNDNGKFPSSTAAAHFSFLQYMQNELFFIASLVDPSTEAYESQLNCTLDDVQIPQSFLDDDIKVVFETSALRSTSPNILDCNEYRNRESLSSVYYSAPQSLYGDDNEDDADRSLYLDENLREPELNSYLHEHYGNGSTASEVLVEPSPSKFQVPTDVLPPPYDAVVCEMDSNKNVATFTLPENDDNTGGDDDSIVSDTPPPKYRESNKLLENTNNFSRFSDISNLTNALEEQHHIEDIKNGNEEYIETPPPSPLTADNSIDAITEAMQAIELNQSIALENGSKSDEIISGFNEMINSEKYIDLKSSRLPLKDIQIGNSRQCLF
uniref:Uncharacterized protein n=1 Tax=Panagrolaimus superbus TaxID=310955 RepID=A0A914YPX0_9BILA